MYFQKARSCDKLGAMKIERRLIEQTPFGVQETFITDAGHIEIWGVPGGYRWCFTDMYRSLRDNKDYPTSGAALEAAKLLAGID